MLARTTGTLQGYLLAASLCILYPSLLEARSLGPVQYCGGTCECKRPLTPCSTRWSATVLYCTVLRIAFVQYQRCSYFRYCTAQYATRVVCMVQYSTVRVLYPSVQYVLNFPFLVPQLVARSSPFWVTDSLILLSSATSARSVFCHPPFLSSVNASLKNDAVIIHYHIFTRGARASCGPLAINQQTLAFCCFTTVPGIDW